MGDAGKGAGHAGEPPDAAVHSPSARLCAWIGVGIAAALGGAIMAASARGSPIRAGAVERSEGPAIVFLGTLVVAFTLYVVALALIRARAFRLTLVFAVAAAIQLTPLAGPLLLSRDAYSYWAYGRIAATHDRDPYVVTPARFPRDPSTRAVAPGWRHTTSVYGPAFTAASEGVARAAGSSAERASFDFRLIAALAALAATLLAATIARRKAYAAAFVGWNPLVAVSFAGGGHNDAWMLVLMLAALALATRGRDVAAGGVWLLAAAVKAPALLLTPLLLLRSRRGLWIGAGLAAVALSVAATTAFGIAWIASLGQLGTREARFALPARLEQLGMPEQSAHALADFALVAGAVWLAHQAVLGRVRLALGALLLLLTSPWVLPWYATWPVFLSAVEEDTAAQVGALAFAAYMLSARVPL